MKDNRQAKILELINNNVILTQEELQASLMREGYNVTQSTVSRDIKELKLVKGHDQAGNYRYLSAELPKSVSHSTRHYHELFARSAKNVDFALNNVVVKCYNGMASGAGVAVDALFSDRMLGSLAGDDTVLIVTYCEAASANLAAELKKMI